MGETILDVTCFVKILSLVACAFLILGAYSRLTIAASFEKFLMSFYIM